MPKHEDFKKKMNKWLAFFNEKGWTVKCYSSRAAGKDQMDAIVVDYDYDERVVSFGVPEDEELSDGLMDRVAFVQTCMMLFYSITVDSEDYEDAATNALNVTRTFAMRMDECVYPVLRAVIHEMGSA